MAQQGSFVAYIMIDGSTRPALIVRDWNQYSLSLQVFPDKANDGPDPLGLDWFRSSCSMGEKPGDWRPLPNMFFLSTVDTFNAGPAGFQQQRCTCGDTWIGIPKPSCPEHPLASSIDLSKVRVTTCAAVPTASSFQQPTGGYPR